MPLSKTYKRPPAWKSVYKWYLGQVPEKIEVGGKEVDNPAYKSAIFVVHGMGDQGWAVTASTLRSGLEDALETILEKSEKSKGSSPDSKLTAEQTPSPFISEGFWADYDNLEKSFPDEWNKLDGTKRDFFAHLWKQRTSSALHTFRWFVTQQVRLMNPSVIWKVNLLAWLLYVLPLQLVSFFSLSVLLVLMPRVVARVLGDVRLYVSPKGVIERAIVQRIDWRVGKAFLRMIGLDWQFMPLPDNEKLKNNGKPVVFDRIIWVAHSLGTVVSYNVLSDLFHRAADFEKHGTDEQQKGVECFRKALSRFVTLGSPLDKIAYLFGEEALRPWPNVSANDPQPRTSLLDRGEEVRSHGSAKRKEWWVNFYHVFDPVSGALSNKVICGAEQPISYHVRFLQVLGIAHVGYWRDRGTLQFILGRAYGKEFLPVPAKRPIGTLDGIALALVGYMIWTEVVLAILSGGLHILMWLLNLLGLETIESGVNALNEIIRKVVPFI